MLKNKYVTIMIFRKFLDKEDLKKEEKKRHQKVKKSNFKNNILEFHNEHNFKKERKKIVSVPIDEKKEREVWRMIYCCLQLK